MNPLIVESAAKVVGFSGPRRAEFARNHGRSRLPAGGSRCVVVPVDFRRCRCARGLTLVEMLVSLVIVALIAAALTAAMWSVSRNGDAVIERRVLLSEQRNAFAFLQRQLAAAEHRPVEMTELGLEDSLAGGLRGSDQRLSWVARLQTWHGVAGLVAFTLQPSGGAVEGRTTLVLEMTLLEEDGERVMSPLTPGVLGGEGDRWQQASNWVVAEALSDFRIEYREALSREWSGEWSRRDVLPDMVRLSGANGLGAFEFLIPLRVSGF
ncbi:MAG: prepilin-type N-terminal cleavage/methylation domain-containing protein [Thioalkalivibrionaceae bacterium]